jgi:hypothetical protein
MTDDGLGEPGGLTGSPLQTGVPGLDAVLGGRLPVGRIWLLTGSAAPTQAPSTDAGA